MKKALKLLGIIAIVAFLVYIVDPDVIERLGNKKSAPSRHGETTTITTENVKTEIKAAKDLVSTKVFYKDADTYENHKRIFDKMDLPLTSTKAVFTYEGTVLLGIDLDKVYVNVDNDRQEITITLPSVTILANDIDFNSFVFYEDKQSVFNINKFADYVDLLAELKDRKKDEILSDQELMKSAKVNSENAIKGVLLSSGAFNGYEIEFSN